MLVQRLRSVDGILSQQVGLEELSFGIPKKEDINPGEESAEQQNIFKHGCSRYEEPHQSNWIQLNTVSSSL